MKYALVCLLLLAGCGRVTNDVAIKDFQACVSAHMAAVTLDNGDVMCVVSCKNYYSCREAQ